MLHTLCLSRDQIHTLSAAEGEALYGGTFYNYVTLTAMHNSNTYCYHDGMQFLTSHPMFSLMVRDFSVCFLVWFVSTRAA